MASLDWSHCPAVESIPGKVEVSKLAREGRFDYLFFFLASSAESVGD